MKSHKIVLPFALLWAIVSCQAMTPEPKMSFEETRDVVLSMQSVPMEPPSRKMADLSRKKILAFASHALLPGDLDGLTQPALAFSSPVVTQQDEDGLLTVGEILTLKLNADLVVLSACNLLSTFKQPIYFLSPAVSLIKSIGLEFAR